MTKNEKISVLQKIAKIFDGWYNKTDACNPSDAEVSINKDLDCAKNNYELLRDMANQYRHGGYYNDLCDRTGGMALSYIEREWVAQEKEDIELFHKRLIEELRGIREWGLSIEFAALARDIHRWVDLLDNCANLETITKNKRGRGRPRKYTDQALENMCRLYEDDAHKNEKQPHPKSLKTLWYRVAKISGMPSAAAARKNYATYKERKKLELNT